MKFAVLPRLIGLMLVGLLLAGCGPTSAPPSLSLETTEEETEPICLEDVRACIQSEAFQNKSPNYKVELRETRRNNFVSFADVGGPEFYTENPPASRVFIANNGNYYLDFHESYFLFDSERGGFLRVTQNTISYSDRESLTIFEELYEYGEVIQEPLTYGEKFLYRSDLYKTSYPDKETFALYSDFRDPCDYYLFFREDLTVDRLEQQGDRLTFALSVLCDDGERAMWEGWMDLKTFDVTYTQTSFKEGILDVETVYSITHGDFPVEYDTSKDYRIEEAH